MKLKMILAAAIIFSGFFSVYPQEKTEINDKKAASMLLGRHKLSLQWISWDYFGSALVTNKKGVYRLKGTQKSRENSNFVSVEGVITSIDSREFKFSGKITTQVDHIFGGKPCEREGDFTFRITGKRKYWRMMQINNPCEEVADYVDIFFR